MAESPADKGSPRERNHDRRDERELSELDADVEGKERERDVTLRKPEVRERAREAEAVQQAEGEGHEPRPARGELSSPRRMRTISQARSRMLSAITASTGGPGTCTTPRVASASVIECASVNAVMVMRSTRRLRTIRISASTKSR